MNSKTELSIAAAIILLLLGVSGTLIKMYVDATVGRVQLELSDARDQNRAQWQEAARTKECLLREMMDLKQRQARVEGYHEAEKRYCPTKKGE